MIAQFSTAAPSGWDQSAAATDTMSRIFFLHIPRTGGTSLIEYLDRKMAASGVCPAHEMFEFERLADQGELGKFGFYRGHFGINLPSHVDRDGQIITFLRRPIPRLFSAWRHMRSHAMPFVNESDPATLLIQSDAATARQLGFEDFCYYMMQTAGLGFFNGATGLLGRGRGRHLLRAPPMWAVQRELLEQAKRTLDQLTFVGFTETFDRSVAQMQRQFSWPKETIGVVNAAPDADFPRNSKFIDWLRFTTRLDEQLYDYAWRRRSPGSDSAA